MRLADQGATDIISMHVTAKSSGTFNSASIAKANVAERVRVHVIDSGTTSMHMGHMLIEAEKAIQAGVSLSNVLGTIEYVKQNSGLHFTVPAVEHLEASGRTVGSDKVTDTEIKVKPVIGIVDGRPQVLSPERTQRTAIDQVIELTKARLAGKTLRGMTVVHGNALDRAQALRARIPAELGYHGEIIITDFGPGLAVHFGPGLLGIAVYGE